MLNLSFKKILKLVLLAFFILFLLFVCYFFIGTPPQSEEIIWGVNFSQKHSEDLGLDWRENYSSLLDDLGVKHLKVITHWDLIEPEKDYYYFEDLDWQIKEAENHNAEILLVVGMKTGRWPECHIPEWAKSLSKEDREKEVLELVKEIISIYGGSTSINAWQVENEPFFSFGECPKISKQFVKKEIDLVKSLDKKNRQIVVSDSGEFSFYTKPAKLGDIIGITMYEKVWSKELKTYINYPFPPNFYWRKAQIIKKIFNKEVICAELQAEPWGPSLLYDLPIEEQRKTMNLEQFRKNIEFAKKTGLDEFYLWGSEWWYWMKTEQNQPEIWNETQNLFEI